jgi:AcrR family transcriptional regulator
MNAGKPATGARPRRIRGLDAEQRREQRRRQLLDSALELFAEQGYHGTSIEQICQHAYVGTKGFYETFDGREDCYIALLQEITEQLQAYMLERLETVGADGEQAERMLVEAFAHALIDDPRRALVTFGGAGAISAAVERQRRRNRRWAAAFVESLWDRHGVASPGPDVRRIAIGLVGGLFDLISDWLLDADPRDHEHVEALIRDLSAFYTVVRAGVGSA